MPTPNIILITTDQQRTDSLACYGSSFVRTPNLDTLAAQGVRFDRAYVTNPVCTPSRISIFTGQLPSRHGAWNVGVKYTGPALTLPARLASAGYQTKYIGKTHFETYGGDFHQSVESLKDWPTRFPAFTGPYHGFENVELSLGHTTFGLAGHYGAHVLSQVGPERFAQLKTARLQNASEYNFHANALDWDLPTSLHNSTWTADRSIDFLRNSRDPQKPFFLAIGFQDPHHPHALPRDYANRISPSAVHLPDHTPGELADKPPHFTHAHEGALNSSPFRGTYAIAGQTAGADYRRPTPDQAKAAKAYYYSMVQLIDDQMGRILQTLDELNLSDNTIIIFTSDHGELLGDHGLWMKGPFLYEQLVRVPLIIRWPAGFSAGLVTHALHSHTDLTPTLLAAAGIPLSSSHDGIDQTPVLTGQAPSLRQAAFVECIDDPTHLRLKSIITATRKLTWYAGQSFGELYDLALDPSEKINRWSDPAYASDRAQLLSALLDNQEPLEPRLPRQCYA